jgi:glycosyltransferase involved in cell wall biosynthesis
VAFRNEKIAFVLLSEEVGGTQRRIGNLFKFLSERYPDKYYLILNRKLFDALQKANYGLDKYNNIHIIEKKSVFDFKKRAHSNVFINFGRVFTLIYYRKEIKKIIGAHDISTLQVYLEMVPFLGVFPIKKVKSIASLVSHLPKYYAQDNFNCKLLLYALGNFDRIDALYEYIGEGLLGLGVPREKVNYPRRNFVNHIQFKPVKKERILTFSARMLSWKHPSLFLDSILMTIPYVEDDIVFYLMGGGTHLKRIQREIEKRNLEGRIKAFYCYDPSTIVNKSLIHVSLEEYDNFTNQSLLEGMASGCAVISSDVGLTKKVVTPDVGILVGLSAKEISDAMRHLFDNPDLIESMGKKNRKKILDEHSIDMYIDYITKVQDFDNTFHIINGEEVQYKNSSKLIV